MRKHKITVHNFIVYGFLAVILVMMPFIYFFWDVKPEALSLVNIFILLMIVIFSIIANLFTIYSLKKEDVSEIEPIRLMQPLFTILLAFILSFFFTAYSNEGSLFILILALIASLSLVLSHIEKNHFKFNKYAIAAIIGSFLFSVELVLSKFILEYYNGISLYFIRSLFIFLIVWIMFHKKLGSIKNKTKWMIFVAGIVFVIYRLIVYYGYQTLGIVFTTMLLILAPIFVYLFAWIYLKEKITWKQIASSVVIIICIILAIVIS